MHINFDKPTLMNLGIGNVCKKLWETFSFPCLFARLCTRTGPINWTKERATNSGARESFEFDSNMGRNFPSSAAYARSCKSIPRIESKGYTVSNDRFGCSSSDYYTRKSKILIIPQNF